MHRSVQDVRVHSNQIITPPIQFNMPLTLLINIILEDLIRIDLYDSDYRGPEVLILYLDSGHMVADCLSMYQDHTL